MKFFKKTSVAILLTALLVVLCCVWGYSRAYEATHSDPDSVVQSQRAGESGLNYFLNWIDDGAGLFSMETTDTLARNNLDLNNTYGCLLALKTVNYLNGQDIASYSKDLFQQVCWTLSPAARPGTWSTAGDCEPRRRITTPWPPC